MYSMAFNGKTTLINGRCKASTRALTIAMYIEKEVVKIVFIAKVATKMLMQVVFRVLIDPSKLL